jgi:RND family efflux transporter MFP subunit
MKLHSLASLLAATLLAAACGTPATAPSEPDVTEAVHEAAPAVAAKAPAYVGVVSSRVSKVITADFQARVERLAIRNGQLVKAGDVVAELDPTQLRLELEKARGAYAAAKGQAGRAGAAFTNARRRAALEQRLIRRGASAPEAYRNAMAEASGFGADGAAARGEMQRAAAQIAELQDMIGKAQVRAPLDGVVSVVKIKEGEVPSKGTPIARVFDPNQLVVRFAVPRADKPLVQPGTAIELVTTTTKQVVPATVKHEDADHDPSIDFTVFEAVIDPDHRIDEIRVGDNGTVRIATNTAGKGAAR